MKVACLVFLLTASLLVGCSDPTISNYNRLWKEVELASGGTRGDRVNRIKAILENSPHRMDPIIAPESKRKISIGSLVLFNISWDDYLSPEEVYELRE